MKVATVKDFKNHATQLLRGTAPVLVTRHGRIAGIFFPSPEESLPLEFKRELFEVLSAQVARDLKRRRVTEQAVLADFEEWRKKRREARRRR